MGKARREKRGDSVHDASGRGGAVGRREDGLTVAFADICVGCDEGEEAV